MSTTDPQALHALAFLYLSFGHSTDGTLSGDEMRTLATKLRAWAPDSTLEQIGELLRSVVGEYKALSSDAREEKGEAAVELLRGQLDAEQRARILADLQAIAEADGNVSSEESSFIDRLTQLLA
ncbi:MAG: TerB family tellurite resistance protein [Deltaproteobacteria bacterium]|nr:TerB family tellurite resistance protein [Deltaproteobacteria bacterium]